MILTGAQILWECLVREGVDTVFGYPGGAILPAYDAMLDFPVRHVLVRHEQGAAHMADGYARASGKVGVAIATSGPGATNLTTGIATAMMDSIPTVFITGQVPSKAPRHRRLPGDGRHRHHPAHHQAQRARHRRARHRRPRCARPSTIARTGGPGPVLVDICKDAQQAKTRVRLAGRRRGLRGYRHRRSPSAAERRRALELIAAAERPLILAGHGVLASGACEALRAFAEKTRHPGGPHAARPRRLPGQPSAVPRA